MTPKSGGKRDIEGKIVLLALLLDANLQGMSELTKTQVHKFMFISEQHLWQKKILSTGMRFIKMFQGPWSQDMEDVLTQLEQARMVTFRNVRTKSGDHAILTRLTADGLAFANSCVDYMNDPPGSTILESIHETTEKYGAVSSEELQEMSHRMKNLVTGKRISDIPPRQYILLPRPLTQAREVFSPSEEITETLDILLNREVRESLERAIQGAQKRPLRILASLDDLED